MRRTKVAQEMPQIEFEKKQTWGFPLRWDADDKESYEDTYGRRIWSSLVGKKFGRLTVLKLGPSKFNRPGTWWICMCECGNCVLVSRDALAKRTKKATRSCGCLHVETAKARGLKNTESRLPDNQAARNSVFHVYKTAAERRGYSFSLSREFFEMLIKEPCSYCGKKPSNRHKDLTYSGIDRIDNAIGYEQGNVVTCCKECNLQKRAMSRSEFISHAKEISDWQNKTMAKQYSLEEYAKDTP